MKYGAALVGGASHPATFVRVYDIYGPTYPGEFDANTGAYTLHYPGVAFWFPIPPAHAQRCRESQVRPGASFECMLGAAHTSLCLCSGVQTSKPCWGTEQLL